MKPAPKLDKFCLFITSCYDNATEALQRPHGSVAVSSASFRVIGHCRSLRFIRSSRQIATQFLYLLSRRSFQLSVQYGIDWKTHVQWFRRRLTQADWYLDRINQTSRLSVYTPSHLDLIVDLLQSIIRTTLFLLSLFLSRPSVRPSNIRRVLGRLPLSLE